MILEQFFPSALTTHFTSKMAKSFRYGILNHPKQTPVEKYEAADGMPFSPLQPGMAKTIMPWRNVSIKSVL